MKYNIYTDNLKLAVFDIETTGLSPERDQIISASFCDEDGSNLRQYFSEDKNSEFLFLTKIIDEFNSLDGVLTYNGAGFDIPFFFKKINKYGLTFGNSSFWNIDIYKYLKSYWAVSKLLPNLKQKSVEHALGLSESRLDEISGSEVISLYSRFLSGDYSSKDTILLHNADDVLQLSKISSNLSFLPFGKISFELGFAFKKNDLFFVRGIQKTESQFVYNGTVNGTIKSVNIYNDWFTLISDDYSGSIYLELNCKCVEHFFYVDLTKFPVQEEIFKSMAEYSNGYLIASNNDVVNYDALNLLASELIGGLIGI